MRKIEVISISGRMAGRLGSTVGDRYSRLDAAQLLYEFSLIDLLSTGFLRQARRRASIRASSTGSTSGWR
jgi:hypothetical protein